MVNMLKDKKRDLKTLPESDFRSLIIFVHRNEVILRMLCYLLCLNGCILYIVLEDY